MLLHTKHLWLLQQKENKATIPMKNFSRGFAYWHEKSVHFMRMIATTTIPGTITNKDLEIQETFKGICQKKYRTSHCSSSNTKESSLAAINRRRLLLMHMA